FRPCKPLWFPVGKTLSWVSYWVGSHMSWKQLSRVPGAGGTVPLTMSSSSLERACVSRECSRRATRCLHALLIACVALVEARAADPPAEEGCPFALPTGQAELVRRIEDVSGLGSLFSDEYSEWIVAWDTSLDTLRFLSPRDPFPLESDEKDTKHDRALSAVRDFFARHEALIGFDADSLGEP